MAKRKDDFSDPDDDNMEFDLGDIDSGLDDSDIPDWDDPSDKVKNKRRPVLTEAKGVASEVTPPKVLAGIGHKIAGEFRGFEKAYDSTISTISELERLKSDTFKELAPSMARLKQVGRTYAPKVKKILPDKLYAKLESILEDNRYSFQSEEDQRSAAIAEQLQSIFSQQNDIQAERYIRDKTDEIIKSGIESSRHEESVSVLSQIRNILKNNQAFVTGTFTKYLMKSLELKYRHLYLAKDLVDQSKETAMMLTSKLDAIKQNTALPDMVKRQKSEEAVQAIKDRMYGSMAESFGDWTSKFRSNLIKNVKEQVLQKATDTINQVINTGADSLEMMEEMRASNAEMGIETPSLLSGAVGALLRKVLVDIGGAGVRAGVGKQRLEDVSELVSNFQAQLPNRIAEYAESKEGAFGDFLRLIVPARERERGKLENVLEKGTDEVPFDVITRRSIIEIIPGFLSKIHQQSAILTDTVSLYVKDKISVSKRKELESLSDREELVYDRELEDFISAGEFKARAVERIFGTKTKRTRDMEDIISTMYASYQRHDDDTAKFEQYLPDIVKVVTNLSKHGDIIRPKLILAYLNGDVPEKESDQLYLDYLFKDIPDDIRPDIADILAKTFFISTEDELEDKDARISIDNMIRAFAVEKDKFQQELSSFNAYGGKRYVKELTSQKTDKELAPHIIKLRRKFEDAYGKNFDKDPIKLAEFNSAVEQLRRIKGIGHETIRGIQSDVDVDYLKEVMTKRSTDINTDIARKEKLRESEEFDEDKTFEKIGEAMKSELDVKLEPFKKFYRSITKRIPTAKEIKEAKVFKDIKLGKFPGPKDKDEIDELSEDTGIPNRDGVQVSGPGLYYQGVKRELHIPLDKFTYDAEELITSVKEQLNAALTKTKDKVGEKLSMENVLKVQIEAIEGIGKLTNVIDKKSTALINQFGGFTDSMRSNIATLTGSMKSNLRKLWNTNDSIIKGRMKFLEMSDEARYFLENNETAASLIKKGKDAYARGTAMYGKGAKLTGDAKALLTEIYKDPKKFGLEMGVKATEYYAASKQKLSKYREDLLTTPTTKKLDELLDYLKNHASITGQMMLDQSGSTEVSGGFFSRGIKYAKNLKNRIFKKKPNYLEGILHGVMNIEQMLSKQFGMTDEIEATKLYLANQQLAVASRAEVLSSGNLQAINKIPLWSRAIQFPFKMGGKALQLSGRGIVGYYRMLGDIAKTVVPSLAKTAANTLQNIGGPLAGFIGRTASSVGSTMRDLTKSGIDIADKGIRTAGAGARDLLGTLFTKSMAVGSRIVQAKFVDVYRRDEVEPGKPLVKGKDLASGRYTFNDGSQIEDVYSIKQPVLDDKLQVVISEDDINHGLVDVNNKELVKLSFQNITNPIITMGQAAGKFAGGLLKGYATLLSTVAGGAINILKRIPLLKRLFTETKFEDISDVLEDKVTKHLVELTRSVGAIEKTIAKPEIREGSYQDYLRDRAAEKTQANATAAAGGSNRARDLAKKSGLLGAGGMFGGMFGGKPGKGEDTGGGSLFGGDDGGLMKEGGALDTAKDTAVAGTGLAALGWLKSKLFKKGGEQLVKEGAKQAAKGGIRTLLSQGAGFATRTMLGTAARWAAGATAAAVTGASAVPLAIGAAAIGATYLTYKWAKGRNRRKALTEIRNEAYRVPEDKLSILEDFEDDVYSTAQDGNKPTEKMLLKYMKKFGLDPKSKDQFTFFNEWYSRSFLPIITVSAEMFKDLGGYFDKQHKLDDKSLDQYVNQLKNSDTWKEIQRSVYVLSIAGFKRWNGTAPNSGELTPEEELAKPKKSFFQSAKEKITAIATTPIAVIPMKVAKYGLDKLSASPEFGKEPSTEAAGPSGNVDVAPSHLPTEERLAAYGELFDRAGKRYGVDPTLLKSMTKQESRGKADARSPVGAQGLMQLMPATARELGVRDPFDPEQNVMGGAKYMNQLLKRYDGDTKLALAAYNAGMGNIDKAIKLAGTRDADTVLATLPRVTGKHSKETQGYVHNISGYYAAYAGSTLPSGSATTQTAGVESPVQQAVYKPSESTTTDLSSPIQKASYQPPATAQSRDVMSGMTDASGSSANQPNIPTSIKLDDSKQIALLTEQNKLLSKLVSVLIGTDSKPQQGILTSNVDNKPMLSKLDELIAAVTNLDLNTPASEKSNNIRNVSFSDRPGINVGKQRLAPT